MPGYLLLIQEGWGGVSLFSQSCPWWCFRLKYWSHTMLQPRQSSYSEVKQFPSHTSAPTHSSPHCRDTSVWNLGHYHWAGRLWSRLVLEQRVRCFFISFVLVRHFWSDLHVHQITVYDFWQGRCRIRWIIGSYILSTRIYPYNQMVCDGISITVGHYSVYIGSTPWLGTQLWVVLSISHQLGYIQVTCNRMVLVLQFSLSIFVHLEITCKYGLPWSVFCWDQTQIRISSIPDCLSVEYNWYQRGLSFFAR